MAAPRVRPSPGLRVAAPAIRALVLLVVCAMPAAAQGTFNLLDSRNHPELTWSVYDTEHFRLVYSDGLADVARRAGSIAEQAYAIQKQNLGLTFARRYYIFLSDRDQIPNAATTSFGYAFVYVNPARYLTLFSSARGWLELAIPHELVHALLFENTRGWLNLVVPGAGGRVPREMHEGMAQLYGGEPWGAERGDRYLNLMVRNYRTRPEPLAIDAGRATYAAGFAKIKWLRQTMSDQDLGRIFAPQPRRARFSFDQAFERVSGRDYQDVETEWRRAINVYYNWREGTAERTESLGPTLDAIAADELLVVKRAPRGGGTAFSGMRRRQNPNYALYYQVSGESRVTRLAEKNIRDNFSFDRAGERIAFSRWHYGAHGDLLADIAMVDLRTGVETAVTRNLRALEPVFVGPQELVFVRQDGLISNWYRISLSGGAPAERLTNFSTEWHFADLSASPDGRFVAAAFVSPRDQRQGILIYDLETRTFVEKPQPAICRFPLFAPHGASEILFTSEEHGVRNVYRLDLNSGLKTAVTQQANSVLITDWPDQHTALGIRQVDDQPEAFSIDPYRQSQAFPAALQDYYRTWQAASPATAMVIDGREVAGEFRGRFRSLSTFRPLGLVPNLALIKDRLAVGVQVLAGDMPGKHLAAADVLTDLHGSRPNAGLNYLNRATRFDLGAQVAYRDVTTYYFNGDENLYEGIWSARAGMSFNWDHDRHYGAHRVNVGVGAARSEVLSAPEGLLASTAPARDYRMATVSAGYQYSRVQPYTVFPESGHWLAIDYQHDRSIGSQEFSSQTTSVAAAGLQPVIGRRINLLASVHAAAQSGRVPPQNRLGMAKYSSGNSLLAYSKQVYVRGGQEYLPGDRLVSATIEARIPSDLLELVPFIDVARVFGEGSVAAESERHLAAAGVGVRLPPVVGRAVEVGWSRPLNGPSRGGRFYITVQRVAPY